MAIYDKPTKILMREFVSSEVKAGQTFTKTDAARWFAKHYPKLNPNTVKMHVEGMAVNSRGRKHHANIHPGSEHDLFYKIDRRFFRLWNPERDPAPIYKDDIEAAEANKRNDASNDEFDEYDEEIEDREKASSKEFAYERDLKNYLAVNLGAVEPGLRLFEDEGLSGVEFPVGGRFIDILALDANDDFVVVELKVSKGYDRVVGQILRYMAWIEQNMADGKNVRGIIVASDISNDLKLATSRVNGVSLLEYEISFALKAVDPIR